MTLNRLKFPSSDGYLDILLIDTPTSQYVDFVDKYVASVWIVVTKRSVKSVYCKNLTSLTDYNTKG